MSMAKKSAASIAAKVFDKISAKFSGPIQTAILTRTTRGDYDPVSGTYPETAESWTGRAVFADEKAMTDSFPAYVIGSTDRMVYLEGMAVTPKEADCMVIGTQSVVVTRVADIVGVGEFFALIVRNA